MKPKYNYNFTNLQNAVSKLKHNPSSAQLNDIKNELNKFFKDSTCTEIIYTNNINKLFFGMNVYTHIDPNNINDILIDDKPIRIDSYVIEIDSKLLTELSLTSNEITAILLHEVGHLVNDSSPITNARKAIDLYLADNKMSLDIKSSIQYKELLVYAINDTIRKTTSIFNKYDEEILADEFVFMCGYGDSLESSFRKIKKKSFSINKGVSNKFIVMAWVFDVYNNMGIRRLSAISVLNNIKSTSGSAIEKRKADELISSINKVDSVALGEAEYIMESSNKKIPLLKRIQHKGLKTIENELYEFQISYQNITDEQDAIFMLRQISSRMSILDTYINSDDIDRSDIHRWQKLYDKYDTLREELVKKTIYSKKNYGIWIDYNQLDNNR